jgi:hypothetical protein
MKTLILGAAAAVLLHITPTVTLMERPEVVSRLLDGADRFTAREVHLSSADERRLRDAAGWTPPDDVLTFYIGRRADRVEGVLVFMRVDSPHGPMEVAVGFDKTGAIRGVEVTKATVETKPWIVEALRAGLTDHYRGLAGDASPAAAGTVKGKVGTMAEYMAELVDRGVAHAGAAYRLFYR